MKNNFLFILLNFMFLSCKHDSNLKTEIPKVELKQDLIEDSQTKICFCLDGIGSKKGELSKLGFTFSNKVSIVVCGFKEGDIISKFEVFNCENENSITKYNEMQYCRIEFKKDTLEIIELKNLPSAIWNMTLMPISKEIIVIENNSIKSKGRKPFFMSPEISVEMQNNFLDEIERNKDNGLQQDWDWEEIIAHLEVLSLMQNKRAIRILFTIEKLTNFKFSGAIRKQYKEAIAN